MGMLTDRHTAKRKPEKKKKKKPQQQNNREKINLFVSALGNGDSSIAARARERERESLRVVRENCPACLLLVPGLSPL
jgi:hypothetical protein